MHNVSVCIHFTLRGSAVGSINKVTPCQRAQLALGCVTILGQVNHLVMQLGQLSLAFLWGC